MWVPDRLTQLAVSRRGVLAALVAIVGHAWFGSRWAFGGSKALPQQENPLEKEQTMAHENKINWGGSVSSPKDRYQLHLEVDFAVPRNTGLDAKFWVKHGMKGCHVARRLEEAWNKANEDILAVACGPTVEFAGAVELMKVGEAGTPLTDLPGDHSAIKVVDGLFASVD